MAAKTPQHHSRRPPRATEDVPGVIEAADDLHASDGQHDTEGGEGGEASASLLEAAVEGAARAMGYEVVLLEWLGGRGGRVARIYLDHPNGVSLDDCTRMSRIFSNALDAAEADPETPALAALLAQPYTLEVSSPGVDRPLVRLSHFARVVGGRAVIRTRAPLTPGSEQKTFHGHIVGTEVDPTHPADDRRGTVRLKALEGDTIHAIALPDIRRANLVYELPGPAHPGAGHKHPGAPHSGAAQKTAPPATGSKGEH
ncbi:ribosome maturation factor RimP [Nannocystis sp.]|uniref:ribosome maturation factor RimP n=1 Tax=Nannocystis sp. TaxID=1962667 RepID=UPI0024217154|nr:ribosome maturation factor RimP [Nannocystis sp.]MBK7823962.1 ribosome maturation factor RimP [Nannocystis sp.]MBK9754973.1 ribosome maturation factor RimP [Nannocystis sp.]